MVRRRKVEKIVVDDEDIDLGDEDRHLFADYWTVAEYCKMRGITERTWYLDKAQGRAPPSVKIGRQVYLHKRRTRKWLLTQETSSAA